ncbi:hypothetical protein [Leisingera sp. ANG-Vp]|uniref:hypothetical protein n=1 Tax=Leisingera sp. ANG-Vp TaxID=1577896 RepID=UPI00057DB9D0|nr:hypothetical protein [Leisingera sp. ANG-Vp]KIC21624.1 hypothetical protein RA20_03125 [Leisingera sp. ANG-Vp]
MGGGVPQNADIQVPKKKLRLERNSIRVRLWEKDIEFLHKFTASGAPASAGRALKTLKRFQSPVITGTGWREIDLEETEADQMIDFLGSLLQLEGIGQDGEINASGYAFERLIDLFSSEK